MREAEEEDCYVFLGDMQEILPAPVSLGTFSCVLHGCMCALISFLLLKNSFTGGWKG